mgnify:FL=1
MPGLDNVDEKSPLATGAKGDGSLSSREGGTYFGQLTSALIASMTGAVKRAT